MTRVVAWALFFMLIVPSVCNAMDVIISSKDSDTDKRRGYSHALLLEALEKTKNDFGPYELRNQFYVSSRDRALVEIVKGRLLNVLAVPCQPEWESKAVPIRISLDKDLLDYRLLLVHRDNVNDFSKVRTADDLKKFRFGLLSQWVTTKLLEKEGFNVVKSTYYEGLFGMLDRKRFDVLLRGISEIKKEHDLYKMKYPDLMIEPILAIRQPLPVYFYVSPKTPHLKKRIETGLKRMQKDGSFDSIFMKYHGEKTKKILEGRRVIEIPNSFLENQ